MGSNHSSLGTLGVDRLINIPEQLSSQRGAGEEPEQPEEPEEHEQQAQQAREACKSSKQESSE